MAYLTQQEYQQYSYSTEQDVTAHFDFYEREARRYIDIATTGIDGVAKLQEAFPTEEAAVEAVKIAMTRLINELSHINQCMVNMSDSLASGKSGVVSSVSSGAESISYATDGAIIKAAQDPREKNNYLMSVIFQQLSGITDKNGVNLLFGGEYPSCTEIR